MSTVGLTDLKNRLAVPASPAIGPIAATSTLTSTAFDLTEMDGPCFGLLVVGAVSGGTTAATADVKYTECDTAGGTYSDIAGATHPTISASNKCDIKRFMRSKRFVKAVATVAGTSPSLALAVAIFGQKKTI